VMPVIVPVVMPIMQTVGVGVVRAGGGPGHGARSLALRGTRVDGRKTLRYARPCLRKSCGNA
jgi:hypothetical protein